MSGNPSRLSLFIADLKRRGVTRLITVYAVVGLGVIEAFDIIGGRFLLPDWTFKAIIIVTVAGFPVAIILGWIYDISNKKIVKTDPLTPTQRASIKLSWKPGWISVILFLVLLLTTTAFFIVPRPNALGFKLQDWVLIADLENNTGDEVFDKTLLHALSITIDQSRRINIFPRTKAEEVLDRMELDTVKKITLPIALEIAERESIKTVLLLTISELSGSYILSTSLINPFTGETIRSSRVTAEGKDEILSKLNRLAIDVRKDLGDSFQKVHLQTVPLEKATTSSLEALKFLTDARNLPPAQDASEKAALLNRALELDPEFALAHSDLGVFHYTANDRVNGEKHFSYALSQLDRLTERERLWIEAIVEEYRGNRELSSTRWGTFLTKYPDDYGGWFRLGYNYMMLNRLEESLNAFNRAMEVYFEVDQSVLLNIATCYNKLGRYREAIDYYQRVFKLAPAWELNTWINHEYGCAYVKMGEYEKAKEVYGKMSKGNTVSKAQGLRSMALMLMSQGKYAEALTSMHDALVFHISIQYKLSELRERLYLCKIYQAKGMEKEFQSELDHCASYVRDAATEPIWFLRVGMLLVRNGELEKAEEMLSEIVERTNEGNKVDEAAYKQLKGEIELARGNTAVSLELLETASTLMEDAYHLESLARYHMMVGNWGKVILTCEKIVADKTAFGWESQESWMQAHFHLFKAYNENGDLEKANAMGMQILDIWKEADEDLPRLLELKSNLNSGLPNSIDS